MNENEESEDFFSERAREELRQAASEFPELLQGFVDIVLSLTDLEDPEQLEAHEAAARKLGAALSRLNAAEYDWCGEISFWPEDSDDAGYDEEDREELSEDATRDAVLLLRVDLGITDADELSRLAHERGDSCSEVQSGATGGLQALLPSLVYGLEESLSSCTELRWAYAGVSGKHWDVPDSFDIDKLQIFAPMDDDDLRSFSVNTF